MSRVTWKGPYINNNNFEKPNNNFMHRNKEILPIFLGKTFIVHNGNKFKEITITEKMISHKFGEFFFTREKFSFKKKKTKK